MAKPSALRIPVAKRSAGEKLWFVLFASNNQTPPRVSSSVQGFSPGDLSVRFFSWQELVALATSTYIAPSALMANGCIGWSPPSGKPETMVSAGPRSEEHTSELQSLTNLVCRLLLEK